MRCLLFRLHIMYIIVIIQILRVHLNLLIKFKYLFRLITQWDIPKRQRYKNEILFVPTLIFMDLKIFKIISRR